MGSKECPRHTCGSPQKLQKSVKRCAKLRLDHAENVPKVDPPRIQLLSDALIGNMAACSRLWRWIAFSFCCCLCVGGLADGAAVLVPSLEDEARVVRAAALYSQAIHAVDAGDTAAGIAGYRASIEAYPHISGAYNNLAMLVFEQSGNGEQALALLERGLREATAINDQEDVVSIHNNIGYVLREAGGKRSIPHCTEAIKHFNAALDVDASSVDALVNKASALLALGESDEAEELLVRVLDLRPDHASALIDLSHIYFKRDDLVRAVALLDRIIDANEALHDTSGVLGAISNKAVFLREAGHTARALTAQIQALEIAPDDPRALSNVMTMQRLLCDWNELEALEAHLVAVVTARQLSDTSRIYNGAEHYVSLLPYDSTLMELSDAFRRRIAERYSSSFEQPARVDLLPSRWDVATPTSTRLRVGYLSFDFREHPMGHLTLALIEVHDRRLVVVLCFSYGYNDASEWRRRFEERCDVFRDLENATDLQAAQQIARDQVDVLVDLMAHTKGARQGISALVPSRVIVNYLGFPGTTGSSYTHFALVDKQVVPPEVAATTMTESVVYLPTTYQANQYEPEVAVCGACHSPRRDESQDDGAGDCGGDFDAFARCVSDCQRSKRPMHGLPRDGVVFCNFNVNNKMDARSFALWINILRQVPNSVLWLLAPYRRKRAGAGAGAGAHIDIERAQLVEDDDDVRDAPDSDSARIKQSLRAQAAALGVSPSRIVFAPRVSKRAHLARVALVDVFFDSLVYNAHSTASDALWAHVPIVTLWGDTFPSRVAASLISHTVSLSGSSDAPGLADMVPHSLKDYEDLAVLLAHDPSKRLRLRAEIAAQSLRCPLFDTKRTAEAVERALEAMHEVKKLVSDAQQGDKSTGGEGEKGRRRGFFHLAVTPEQSRVWSDPTRASARMNEMEQLENELDQAGDVVAAGNVGARIALASMQLPAPVGGGNGSRRPTIRVSASSSSPSSGSAPLQTATSQLIVPPQSTISMPNSSGSATRVIASFHSDNELAELEHAVAANPDDFSAFIALADWLCDRDRFADVVRVFEMLGDRFLWQSTPDFSGDSGDTSSPPSQQLEKAFLMLTFALDRIGRTDDAVNVAERALVCYESFFLFGYNLGALYRAQGHFSRSDAQQSAVAEAESRRAFATWRDHAPNAHNLVRKRARRPKDALVVAFYCNEYTQSWWGSWGPSSVRSSGLGGSEEAVVFLSQELARLGYWVEVYVSPPPVDETPLDSDSATSGDRSGVSWYPLAAYDPDDGDVHVFVAWRYSVSLAVGKRARRALFWAHDVPTEDTLHSALLETVAHRIVCVSAFQASLFPPRLRSKTVILRNAVDDDFFADGANDDNVFVYSSAPNRGLAQLLLAWPLVRRRLPDASLVVFYGFTPQFEHWARHHQWPRVVAGALSTELTGYDDWRAAMDVLLRDTPGVTYVGLVDHSTLAQAYAGAGFWLFPTAYPETSCISAMKAMANGAVPLTSRFEGSALSETVGAYDQGPVAINSAEQLGTSSPVR